jgi:hypothetical protein
MSELALLAARPIQVTDPDWINNPMAAKPVACHNATLYWLYQAKYRAAPSLATYLDLGFPTDVIKKPLANKNRLQRPPVNGSLSLTAGSVILFVKDGDPKHSCIATGPFRLGGYNQPNWFDESGSNARGVPNGHSIHSTLHIQWDTANASDKDLVRGNTLNTSPCKVYYIKESDALRVV